MIPKILITKHADLEKQIGLMVTKLQEKIIRRFHWVFH